MNPCAWLAAGGAGGGGGGDGSGKGGGADSGAGGEGGDGDPDDGAKGAGACGTGTHRADEDAATASPRAIRSQVLVRGDANGRISAFELVAPAVGNHIFSRYVYDEQGDLVRVSDAERAQTSYEYSAHLLIAHALPDNPKVHYRYDSLNRCVETWAEMSHFLSAIS
jgi:YD repeat-containing protein